jgi:hypothetical protein
MKEGTKEGKSQWKRLLPVCDRPQQSVYYQSTVPSWCCISYQPVYYQSTVPSWCCISYQPVYYQSPVPSCAVSPISQCITKAQSPVGAVSPISQCIIKAQSPGVLYLLSASVLSKPSPQLWCISYQPFPFI